MKRFYIGMLMLGISVSLLAQNQLQQGRILKAPMLPGHVKTPTDTVKPYGITNATQFTVYSYLVGTTNVGYVFGTNNQTKAQAQVFPNNNGYFVEEILIWGIKKDVIGTAGVLNVTLNLANATGTASTGVVQTAPGTLIDATSISNTDIDTSGFITVIGFAAPVYVSGNYAVVLDYTTFGDDSLGIVSCTAGDPGSNETSWVKLNNGTWRTIKKLFSTGIDMYMLVVTDQSTAGIDAPAFTNGMKLSAFPNPAVSEIRIDYALEQQSNLTLTVFDSKGNTVMKTTHPHEATGLHSTVLDTENLPAGTYYIRMESQGNKLTKKMVVSH